jgi:hypothetical protein
LELRFVADLYCNTYAELVPVALGIVIHRLK